MWFVTAFGSFAGQRVAAGRRLNQGTAPPERSPGRASPDRGTHGARRPRRSQWHSQRDRVLHAPRQRERAGRGSWRRRSVGSGPNRRCSRPQPRGTALIPVPVSRPRLQSRRGLRTERPGGPPRRQYLGRPLSSGLGAAPAWFCRAQRFKAAHTGQNHYFPSETDPGVLAKLHLGHRVGLRLSCGLCYWFTKRLLLIISGEYRGSTRGETSQLTPSQKRTSSGKGPAFGPGKSPSARTPLPGLNCRKTSHGCGAGQAGAMPLRYRNRRIAP